MRQKEKKNQAKKKGGQNRKPAEKNKAETHGDLQYNGILKLGRGLEKVKRKKPTKARKMKFGRGGKKAPAQEPSHRWLRPVVQKAHQKTKKGGQ